jgi:phosphoadenosine phosphosulfate reductase
MLIDHNLFGETIDRVAIAHELLQSLCPPAGFYVAFSGGKDSIVIADLCKQSGVKHELWYNHTTVDHPEVVRFIREQYPHCHTNWPKMSMWKLIVKKQIPPTRLARYCCAVLKEDGGNGHIVVTGVRWAESAKRAANRGAIEISHGKKRELYKMNDSDEVRKMIESCPTRGKHIVNPIISWGDDDVWEYIRSNKLPYPSLYDKGYTRLGCIGCPMASNQKQELNDYPTYKKAYLSAFDKMLKARKASDKKNSMQNWDTAEGVMNWWINGNEPTEDTGGLL